MTDTEIFLPLHALLATSKLPKLVNSCITAHAQRCVINGTVRKCVRYYVGGAICGSNLGMILSFYRPKDSQTNKLQIYVSFCVKIYFDPFPIAILLKYSKNVVYFCLKYNCLDCCARKFLQQSF